jgi:hypothetical protein
MMKRDSHRRRQESWLLLPPRRPVRRESLWEQHGRGGGGHDERGWRSRGDSGG